MGMRKFAAAAAALLTVSAMITPVRGEKWNAYNVLEGAEITYVGLDDPHTRDGIYQDIYHLVDNEWAAGTRCEYGNYNAKIINWQRTRYTADGKTSADGDYIGIITFQLPQAAEAAGFRLIHPDVTGAAGVSNPMDFILTNFDVLGSESGEPGTWKVLYEARDLREGSDTEYLYYDASVSSGIPYWEYEGKFDTPMKVSYVALAIHKLNAEKNSLGIYMNMHEFQIFAPQKYTAEPPVTEETPNLPVVSAPVRDPLTVQDFIPTTPLGWTAVSAVLATVCSVGCLLWTRRKEKVS